MKENEQIAKGDALENFPKVSKSRIEAELNVEFRDLEAGYNAQKAARLRQWNEYGFQKYGNEKKGASSIVDSTIFNSIEWMVPTLIQPFVETDNVAQILPEGGDPKSLIVAAMNKELLNYQIKKKLNIYNLFYDQFKTFLVSGSAFMKLTWQEKDPKNGELVGRPIWADVSPDAMRYDWTVKNFCDSHVVTHEEDWTRTEIEQKMRGSKGIIESALDACMDQRGRAMRKDDLRDEDASRKNYVGEMQDSRPKSMDLFTRREHWTMYDVEGKGLAEPIMAVFIDDKLVQVIKNPYEFKRPPFVMAECVRDPLGGPATGWSDTLSDIQKFRTALLRMLSDNLNAQQNGLYEVDRTNVDDIGFQLLRHAPQGSRVPIPVRRPGSINPLAPAPIAQHAFTAWEMLAVEGENRSGNTRYSQGLDSNSLNQTATGIVTITQRSEMRMWEIAKRYAETAFKQMIRMTIALNQQKLDTTDIQLQFDVDIHSDSLKEAGRLMGRDFEQDLKKGAWVELNRKDIGGYFTVDIDVMVGSDRQNRINNLLSYMQYVAPYVGQAIPQEVITYVAVELAELMGLQEIKGLMKESYVGTRGINVPAGLIGGGVQQAAPAAGPTGQTGLGEGALDSQIAQGLAGAPPV